ncbi:MAG: hypothetical protein JHC21_01295 [Thermocrinis sp.]|jgi:hypothetical protein|nr:hypothetical protein [Thermocrinis sp.]MCI4458238.1 hypothetical protein [Thermocrinis sp.]
MDLERTSRYIAQLSRHSYKYAILGELSNYNRELVKRIDFEGFVFYLCRLPSKKEVISYCLQKTDKPFKVYCLASKPLEFPNAPLKLWYDEKNQRLKLIAQKSFINACLNAIQKASEVKYPSPKLYTAHINRILRQLYGILAYTYNDKERLKAIKRKVKHWVVEALKNQYGLKPKDAMLDYSRYVLKFSDVLKKKKATKA